MWNYLNYYLISHRWHKMKWNEIEAPHPALSAQNTNLLFFLKRLCKMNRLLIMITYGYWLKLCTKRQQTTEKNGHMSPMNRCIQCTYVCLCVCCVFACVVTLCALCGALNETRFKPFCIFLLLPWNVEYFSSVLNWLYTAIVGRRIQQRSQRSINAQFHTLLLLL